MRVSAVFFDVDFTLIYPGPTFRGEGYRAFCGRYGIDVDESQFDQAVAAAAPLLVPEDGHDGLYDAEIFINYAARIVRGMGGTGAQVDACAREIYAEWAACHHFELYDDVPDALRELTARGIRVGLISNSHRCLVSFESHFELGGLIAAAVSSHEHGYMKPHPSIFRAALALVDVSPDQALMIGDSVDQDVEGARAVGMNAALIHRGRGPHPDAETLAGSGVPIIRTLHEVVKLCT